MDNRLYTSPFAMIFPSQVFIFIYLMVNQAIFGHGDILIEKHKRVKLLNLCLYIFDTKPFLNFNPSILSLYYLFDTLLLMEILRKMTVMFYK